MFVQEYGTAKSLFVTDQDKRKYVELGVTLTHRCGLGVGAFETSTIRVSSCFSLFY